MLPSVITAVLAFSPPFIDLESQQTPLKEQSPSTPLQITALWLIGLHQNFLTHVDGPRSHFSPCSSRYMKEAIQKHGFFKGSLFGLDRLLRENKAPWLYQKQSLNEDTWIKVDPVP